MGLFNKQQKENLANKTKALLGKKYIITDFCFWEENPPQDYNPLDPNRKPHAIQLVDPDNGSVALLKSGSIIQVIEPK